MSSDAPATVEDPLAEDYPPLDAVDSRWWYWIAAYVVSAVLFVPFVVIAAVAIIVPGIAVGGGQETAFAGPFVVLVLLFVLLLFAAVLVVFAVFAVLPIALYMDARQVDKANLRWQPDPIVYGLLGLAQFVVTPLVGFVVAVYYLFRRHEAVGVP